MNLAILSALRETFFYVILNSNQCLDELNELCVMQGAEQIQA